MSDLSLTSDLPILKNMGARSWLFVENGNLVFTLGTLLDFDNEMQKLVKKCSVGYVESAAFYTKRVGIVEAVKHL